MPVTKPNVGALVEQMPDTDKEIQARQEQAKQANQPEGQPKPKLDRRNAGSKFTGPDPAVAGKIYDEILAGGRESVVELLGLVREPSDADYQNYKAGYVLHGLVIYTGRDGKADSRRWLAETIAAELANSKHSKAVQGFFIRELKWIGGRESVNALGKQLLDDDLCEDAAQALLTIKEGVVTHFRSALESAKGRNRVTILQALGVLKDQESAALFKKAETEEDPNVRSVAAWALQQVK